MSIEYDLIQRLKEVIESDEIRQYISREEDFTRERKMSCIDVMFYVMGLVKTTESCEIAHYCKISTNESISSAAVTQARKKINNEAFHYLLHEVNKAIPEHKTFKGYRILAEDGMQGELPLTKELTIKYPPAKEIDNPKFHAVALYDVLNQTFVDSLLLPAPANERDAAIELNKRYPRSAKDLILLDRGFPSLELIQAFDQSNTLFLMRVSTSFLKEVNEFCKEKPKDQLVHINYTKARAHGKMKNVKLPYEFDLRCVKIPLKNGTTEYLVTNLPRSKFSRKSVGKLYAMRWGIETSFNVLKNAVHIEEFSSRLENAIKQEFYATLIVHNIGMQFLKNEKNAELLNRPTKLRYKFNVRKAMATVMAEMSKLLYSKTKEQAEALITTILKEISKHKTAIRPNRTFKRTFKYGRHPSNYRRNIFI